MLSPQHHQLFLVCSDQQQLGVRDMFDIINSIKEAAKLFPDREFFIYSTLQTLHDGTMTPCFGLLHIQSGFVPAKSVAYDLESDQKFHFGQIGFEWSPAPLDCPITTREQSTFFLLPPCISHLNRLGVNKTPILYLVPPNLLNTRQASIKMEFTFKCLDGQNITESRNEKNDALQIDVMLS